MATRDPIRLERQRVRRNANRAARRAAAAASASTCTACAKRPREAGKKWCTECLDRQRDTPGDRPITAPASIQIAKPRPPKPELAFYEVTDDDIAELERIFA